MLWMSSLPAGVWGIRSGCGRWSVRGVIHQFFGAQRRMALGLVVVAGRNLNSSGLSLCPRCLQEWG